MNINFPDAFGVNKNARGVKYLHNLYTSEVIAKVCTKCGDWHFLNQFNKAGKGFAGTHSLCKSCHSERGKEYRNELKVNIQLEEVVAREIEKMLQDAKKMDMASRRNWF